MEDVAKQHTIPEWIIKGLPAGLVAGSFYAVLRLAYVQFYSQLGLLPEEVGIGRTELLSQAFVGPVIVGSAYSAFLAALLSLALLSMGRLTLSTLLRWVAVGLIAAFIATFALIYVRADRVGSSVVKEGKSVRTIFLDLHLVSIPLLDVRALPVLIQWKQPESMPEALRGGTECMLYLGQADDHIVLYDVKNRRSVRFSASDAILITSREPDQLSRSCR